MERRKSMKKILAAVILLSEGFNVMPTAAPTHELAKAATEEGLKVRGFVVSGWIKMPSRQCLKAAEQLLGRRLEPGNNIIGLGDDELKIYISAAKKPTVSLQLITAEAELAEYYRAFWQKFADIWGGGEIIGITVLGEAYEEMSASEQRRLCRAISGRLKAEGELHQSVGISEGTYFAHRLGRASNVGGRRINLNIVVRSANGRSSVYLAAPFIYQTY